MSQTPDDSLSSRHVKEGPERAPHRAFYYAMGLTEKDIAKPFVGVVSSWNESAPCNTALKGHAEIAKRGVSAAGGTLVWSMLSRASPRHCRSSRWECNVRSGPG